MVNTADRIGAVLGSNYGRGATSKATGVLLVGHGTRDETGVAEFWETVKQAISVLPGICVEGAFLEIAAPDIPQGIARLAERGCQHVMVAPLLLFAAGHAKRDIPTALESAAVRFPRMTFAYSPAFDIDPKLLVLSEQRFFESVEVLGNSSARGCLPENTALVMVGRGSRDAEALQLMFEYARQLAVRLQISNYQVGFLAMAEPDMDLAIEKAINSCPREKCPRRIVVQPHLLFRGELLNELQTRIRRYAQHYPDIEWHVAPHLGPSPLVAEAIVARLTKISLSTT